MGISMLCCVALLAAENPAQVRARVVFGSGPRNEQVADIEPWIRRAAANSGSPLATPATGWLGIHVDEQRIYTSPQGGVFLGGQASLRDGKYKVRLDGCAGFRLQQTATLRPGERRLVKLIDDAEPDNFFVALEAPVSEQAQQRAASLQADAKRFRLELNYSGPEDKPFYRLIVDAAEVGVDRGNPFYRIVQVNPEQAARIIDHLAREGFLDQAVDPRNRKLPPPAAPGYTIKVVAGETSWYLDLGWGLTMIERLEELRDVLPEDGVKDLDFLLTRLSGLRKQWVDQQPALTAEAGRAGSRVRFLAQGGQTIIDVTSESGIGEATIRRNRKDWPESILVRLHLSGLESFKVEVFDDAVQWSLSSTGDNATRVSLWEGRKESVLDQTSYFYSQVRIVGGNETIPLMGGYFEVPLSADLFEGNPAEITLQWIDFYRN